MSEENKENESELNDLLDNALQDFGQIDDQSNIEHCAKTGDNKVDAGQTGAQNTEEFFLEQAKLLADRMNTLFGGGEPESLSASDIPPLPQNPNQILAGFKKMAEAAAMTLQGDSNATDEEVAKYSDSIAQALRGLQEGADNLEAPVSETDVANMFSGLNIDNPDSDDSNSFVPFMEGMMQSLLSAEVLLPSIKDLLDKYPKYLTENADKLSVEEKDRYNKQLELYKIIEGHLENENTNDTPKEKREKFKIVLEDMRKLQEYGQPPPEVLAETAGDLPLLDSAAMGATGGGDTNPQCPTM